MLVQVQVQRERCRGLGGLGAAGGRNRQITGVAGEQKKRIRQMADEHLGSWGNGRDCCSG